MAKTRDSGIWYVSSNTDELTYKLVSCGNANEKLPPHGKVHMLSTLTVCRLGSLKSKLSGKVTSFSPNWRKEGAEEFVRSRVPTKD